MIKCISKQIVSHIQYKCLSAYMTQVIISPIFQGNNVCRYLYRSLRGFNRVHLSNLQYCTILYCTVIYSILLQALLVGLRLFQADQFINLGLYDIVFYKDNMMWIFLSTIFHNYLVCCATKEGSYLTR